jgi:hypothetical protein
MPELRGVRICPSLLSLKDAFTTSAANREVKSADAPVRGGQLWRSTFAGRTWPCLRHVSLNRSVTRSGKSLLNLLADEEAQEPWPKNEYPEAALLLF